MDILKIVPRPTTTPDTYSFVSSAMNSWMTPPRMAQPIIPKSPIQYCVRLRLNQWATTTNSKSPIKRKVLKSSPRMVVRGIRVY